MPPGLSGALQKVRQGHWGRPKATVRGVLSLPEMDLPQFPASLSLGRHGLSTNQWWISKLRSWDFWEPLEIWGHSHGPQGAHKIHLQTSSLRLFLGPDYSYFLHSLDISPLMNHCCLSVSIHLFRHKESLVIQFRDIERIHQLKHRTCAARSNIFRTSCP